MVALAAALDAAISDTGKVPRHLAPRDLVRIRAQHAQSDTIQWYDAGQAEWDPLSVALAEGETLELRCLASRRSAAPPGSEGPWTARASGNVA